MSNQAEWEAAFNTLDKRVFSVDAIGGYDFSDILKAHTTNESAILDFGCGKGGLVKKLRDEGYVNAVGTDPSEGLIKQSGLPSNVLLVMKDGRIPYADVSFDFVYCSGVLHHIEWGLYSNVLDEIKRVLKPGGVFLFSEPRNSIWRKLGHVAVMSPLEKINKQVGALAACLRAEWPTYYPWLLKENAEFVPLCERAGFSLIQRKTKMFTVIGVLKRE